ncbi:MAG TPA: peptide ABC transporter substrate-binding protein [Rhizomicrobium sp.]|nr:peptide ABC transporter substrate-binding protein [Rhizomicrobium sp.]
MRIAAVAALAFAISACSPGADDGSHDLKTLNRGNLSETKSLDPDFIDGQWEAFLVGDMIMGLTTDAANGEPMPGMATKWETSPDGKTWTFHLRDAQWSDGHPVTADDFVFAWQRIINPKTAAPYSYYLWLIKNAKPISEGKLPPSALGIKAIDDKTLVITLEHPAPYFEEYLLHQTTWPLPRHVVEAKGQAWSRPENYVANGPYIVKEWVPNDHLTMVKNPKFFDAAHVKLDTIIYYPTTDNVAAINRLRSGELDTLYTLPAVKIDWLRANMKKELSMVPSLVNYYLVLNFEHKPLNDPRIREALNLAYNREEMADKIIKLGDPPAYSFVPPGTAHYPVGAGFAFKSLTYPQRIQKAQELMKAAGYGPNNPLKLGYETTTTPDSKRYAAAYQAMLKAIYVDIDIVQIDTQIHYRNMQQHSFDIATAAWVADFNDASTFLDLLQTGAGNNYGSYSNPKFDALLAQAQDTADAKVRGELLKQAEQIALDDYAVVPTRFGQTLDIVMPQVKGWTANMRNFNRSRWLWKEEVKPQ